MSLLTSGLNVRSDLLTMTMSYAEAAALTPGPHGVEGRKTLAACEALITAIKEMTIALSDHPNWSKSLLPVELRDKFARAEHAVKVLNYLYGDRCAEA